jgi:glutathione S-transferase
VIEGGLARRVAERPALAGLLISVIDPERRFWRPGGRIFHGMSECGSVLRPLVQQSNAGLANMSKSMTPTITAFERSPDRGRGLARDMRVRWALEEVGQPYDVRLLSFGEMKESAHRKLHPFGQIPTYEKGDLALFESGAIVLYIAERHAGLLPDDANARARAITWIFAALTTVEPPIIERSMATLFERDKPWYEERLAILDDRVHARLRELSSWLGDADWLDGEFSAGDLLMVTVLRRLNSSGVLEMYPSLSAYIARGEARPAYKRAFDDQLAVFTRQTAGSTGPT